MANQFKIIDIYLENFAKIYTGMHIDKLYLNFLEMPNKTYLFVGDSGSGKSSILKSIHPFAFNSGTGDESSNSDLIMSGRDGRKIIRYLIGNTEINCTHLYIRKSDNSIQIKSYFSINGEELNPSGLVTTFKELVSKYFFIDESFLTLLALGNSVRSMVEYTASERKKLAVKIFSELSIYMTYYKNASIVVRDLKTILSNVVDKLGRYGQYDKSDLKKRIKSLQTLIYQLETKLAEVLKSEGAIKKDLEINQESYNQYASCEAIIGELLIKIERIKAKRKSGIDVIVLENQLNELNKSIIESSLKIEALESTIKSELDFRDLKASHKKTLEESIRRIEGNIDKIELEKLLANISAELVTLSEIEIQKEVDYTKKKDDLIRASIYLDELRGLCTDLVTEVRDPKLIPEVLRIFLQDIDYGRKLDQTYSAIVEKIQTMESTSQLSGRVKIPNIDGVSCQDRSCPYKQFYQVCLDVLTKTKEQYEEVFHKENDGLKEIEDRRTIFWILKKLYDYIDKHQDYFNGLPTEIFDPRTFVTKFMSNINRQIYNTDLMSSSISYLEQAVRKVYLLSLEESTKKQIAGLNTTIELYNSTKVDLERTIQAIKETDEVVAHHQKDLAFNRSQLDELNQSAKELSIEIDLAKELTNLRVQVQDIQHQMSLMDECKKRFDSLSDKLRNVQTQVSSIQDELNGYRNQLNSLVNTLELIESLEKEKEMLMTRYSEAVLIRDAVSPSKGIPVEFIDNVIRNQMIDSINELIHVAYPDITLIKDPDKLIIDDKEFTIPYKKNGVIVGDISEASDGERAMLSLAFSLVLIRLVSKVYNVMLLDEMDTALDKYGRSKYIDIIEKYMRTISASQIFLISHNSMFDMYDVNVLITTEGTIHESDDKYVVPIYKQNFTPKWIKV